MSSAPVSVWMSCFREKIAELLSIDSMQETLPENLTCSQIAWLPQPGQKPDKPDKLRPIGVVAPEGKILAGHARRQSKSFFQSLLDKPQFGFVLHGGTEEAIGEALAHMMKAGKCVVVTNAWQAKSLRAQASPTASPSARTCLRRLTWWTELSYARPWRTFS